MGDKFIDWLKKEMSLRGWSQRELARHSDVTHAYISKVIKGDQPVTVTFCFSMADALNEPVWKLLLIAGFIKDVPPEVSENQNLRLMMKIFNGLSLSGQKDALSYLQWLAAKEDNPS